mgnify:CR=1 FL=1
MAFKRTIFHDQIRNNIRSTYLLIIGFILFFTVFIYAVGIVVSTYYGDPSIAWIFLVFALLFSFISSWASYYYSDKIVIASVGARPADPVENELLYDLVEGLRLATGLSKAPAVYIMDDPSPNAFATGRNPEHSAIVVTRGLLERLDKYELEGVLAHEMGHVINYDILLATIISVLVGTVVIVSHFIWRMLFWGGGGGRGRDRGGGAGMLILLAIGIIFLILAPIAAQIIQLAMSRKREYLADATAVKLTRNPEGLAGALEKIANYPYPVKTATGATAHLFIDDPLKRRRKRNWWAELFSTHPDIWDRIERIRSM